MDRNSEKDTMNTQSQKPRWRLASERGATMVEYAMLVSLIAVASVVVIGAVAAGLDDTYQVTAASLDDEGTGHAAPGGSLDGGGGDGGSVTTTSMLPAGPGTGGTPGPGDSTDDGEATTTTTAAPESTTTTTLAAAAETETTESTTTTTTAAPSGSTGGGGGETTGTPNQTETVGEKGEFSVTFVEIDGVVQISEIDAAGWDYEITMDKDHQIHIDLDEKGSRRTAKVKGWLTGNGTLKASANVQGKK